MKYRSCNRKRDESGLLLQDAAVMRLLLLAKTRAEVGEALNMPPGTVNTCCKRVYSHTGCKGQTELMLKHGASSTASKTEEITI